MASQLQRRMLATALAALFAAQAAWAQMDFEPRPLDKAPEGDFSLDSLPNGYSHVAMLTWPQIKPQDLEKAPKVAAKYAEMFGVVLLADVRPNLAKPGTQKLSRIAIGQTIREGQSMKIVTPRSKSVTFIASQVLASGAKELDRAQLVARYDTAMLFDAPQIMRRGSTHRELIVRHFVWTNSKQGGLATVLWLVDNATPESPRLVDRQFVQIPDRFVESRTLSVDHGKFSIIGMPGKTAFAFEDMPKGARYAFSPELAKLAVLPRFDSRTLPQLAIGLSQTIASGQTLSQVNKDK